MEERGCDVEAAFAEEEDGARAGVGAGWKVIVVGGEVVEVDLKELG